MSCLLNVYGKISNLSNIIQFLDDKNGSGLLEGEPSTNFINGENLQQDEWSNNWDWNDGPVKNENSYDKNEKETVEQSKSQLWLDKYQICISPCANLILIAYKKNLLILQSKLDKQNELEYSISSRISIAKDTKSGEGLIEWTCIVAGFDSGNVRFYTENGTLLSTQMFHDNRVVKMKCRTNERAKYIGWINQAEEVHVLYEKNVLVCIDGCGLYHYLKTARIYAAKAEQLYDANLPLTLDYKKWCLEDIETLSDFISAGMSSENRFDQLFSASMLGGPYEQFRQIPPIGNRFITCGNVPFTGFYNAIDGLSGVVLTDVAKAVAGKVTNVLLNAAKGWMGFNKTQANAKPKAKIEPPAQLPARCALPDLRRLGESIIVSPGNNLAATTDSFARVILIDVLKGIAVRMFKGYRDAQIGWIAVDDESDMKLVKKYALYLIIYATRRGLLEIWGCQQGIRVAAFNIGKKCKLFYPGYFMLSLNGSLLNEQNKLNKQMQCFILDSEGLIKTFQIPFHLILSDKSNQRVRDTLLFKKLKALLKIANSDNDKLWNELHTILKDFKTPLIREQALEKLINTPYLSTISLRNLLNQLVEKMDRQSDNKSSESKKLTIFCKYNLLLIDSFEKITEFYKANERNKYSPERVLNDEKTKELGDILGIEYEQLNEFISKTQKQITSNQNSVSTSEANRTFSLQDYLACFECTNKNEEEFRIIIKHNLTESEKQNFGTFLFQFWFDYEIDFEKIDEILEFIPLNKPQLLDLMVFGWLKQKTVILSNVKHLTGLINKFYESLKSSKTYFDFEFDFLLNLKYWCESTKNLSNALIIAWIFRDIAIKNNLTIKTVDTMQMLCHHLFCLNLINALCQTGATKLNAYLEYDLTLKNILNKSRDVLSQIVAKHVVFNGYDAILLTTNDETDETIFNSNKYEKDFYDHLQNVRVYLSKSLEPDILLVNAAWESIMLFCKEQKVQYLEYSLNFCSKIGNAVLKQGVLSMIWHNFVCKKIAALTNLIEKIGKAPKDRLCRKDIGISEDEILKFTETSLVLLDLVMDANCSINEIPIFNYDQFWSDFDSYTTTQSKTTFNDDLGRTSNLQQANKQLVELAAEQKYINYHLCLFHYQFIRILYLLIKYNIKPVRALGFYDTKGKLALFSELHTHPLLTNDIDVSITNARIMFFTKVINAIIEQIQRENNEDKLSKEIHDEFNLVLNLSKDMGIDAELIKRHFCCTLFGIGYYSEAEKLLHSIKERELAASQLLIVLGRKVNLILNEHFNANTLAMLSTNLSSWLKSIDNSDYKIHKPKTRKILVQLIGIVIKEMPETFSEHKIAVELFDFINNLDFEVIPD